MSNANMPDIRHDSELTVPDADPKLDSKRFVSNPSPASRSKGYPIQADPTPRSASDSAQPHRPSISKSEAVSDSRRGAVPTVSANANFDSFADDPYKFPSAASSPPFHSATHVSTRSRNTSAQHVIYPNPMLSVFWKANDPAEWTMDRVIYWLEYNKFGPDWIETFRQRNLQGKSFLELVSYKKLKSLGPLSATNDIYDTKPSRFIHILRKVLDRSSSSLSNNAIGEPDDYNNNTNSNNNLVEKPADPDFHSDKNAIRPPDASLVQEHLDPMSLRVRTHKSESFSKSQHSPSSPTSFSHFFSRRNTKSTSSESSVSALPVVAKLPEDNNSNISFNVNKKPEKQSSGGILHKLRRKDRSNSKDHLYTSRSTSNLLVSKFLVLLEAF